MGLYYLIGFITVIGIFTAVLSWFVFYIRPMSKRMMNMLDNALDNESLHRLVTVATCPNRPDRKDSNYDHCARFYDAIRKHPIIWTIFFADRK